MTVQNAREVLLIIFEAVLGQHLLVDYKHCNTTKLVSEVPVDVLFISVKIPVMHGLLTRSIIKSNIDHDL